jgi:cbb3-type cytochrome oxidase maturation protein
VAIYGDEYMEVLPLLIIISLGVIALAVWIFFRMSDSGQFDDTESPARRILMDDDRPQAQEDKEKRSHNTPS